MTQGFRHYIMGRCNSGLTALLVVVAASSSAAVTLDVKLASSSGDRVIGAWSAELEAGLGTRFVSKVEHAGGAATIVLDLTLIAEEDDRVTVSVHGRVRGGSPGRAIDWTARRLVLDRGHAEVVEVRPIGLARVTIGYGVADDAPAVYMATTFLIHERDETGIRLVSQQRVRLDGPQPVEVILVNPGDSEPLLVLRLAPRARDEDGAVLSLGIESRDRDGKRTIRAERLELAWDDVVRIAGLRSPTAEILVDIKPER